MAKFQGRLDPGLLPVAVSYACTPPFFSRVLFLHWRHALHLSGWIQIHRLRPAADRSTQLDDR